MPEHWNLFFSDYLIYDGWGHIRVGQEIASSGLDFWSAHPLLISTDRRKSAIPLPAFRYSVSAEVVFRSDKACILDFGLFAFGTPDLLPDGAKIGEYVTGNIGLGIDRSIAVSKDIERSIPKYKWRVDGITADVSPFIPFAKNSPTLVRDDSRLRFEEVQSTSTIEKELGKLTAESMRGGFYLCCKLINFNSDAQWLGVGR